MQRAGPFDFAHSRYWPLAHRVSDLPIIGVLTWSVRLSGSLLETLKPQRSMKKWDLPRGMLG
jgi:hypothetical protein